MERIDDEDDLYRRILDYHYNPETGQIAASAFMRKGRKLDPEVSVFLARLSDPDRIMRAGLPRQRLIAMKAAVPRAIGLEVRHDPNQAFPGHCVLVGFGPHWKEQCALLAEASYLVDLPAPAGDSAPILPR